ncbi:Myosin motor domain-containing protein [Caenorhabditis elegans]|uniref:Myosin motor domain-containing protein n=1 Tax=Caenorhabditis elegans TaxID=6239 RepID=Q20357_CAEEL|nr:Myosin motor domain-containing protein [Caenorhabditis elegans]CCD67086.1 Myosin motor domain-containing protein [Caenorhabditis elegans]|eukprot:NP_508817.3 Heavy chain, Unconventional Myosin [Caenorhabditis elegans]
MDPPPPPPHNKSSTMLRNPAKSVDVNRLRSDIEILSQQLEMVKARLESALAEQDDIDEKGSKKMLSRDNSIDSRLSTSLFSSGSHDSCAATPIPHPEQPIIPPRSNSNLSKFNKALSMSTSHLTQEIEEISNKRLSMALPSSSAAPFITSLKRRETFTKVDEITKELNARIGKVKRTESLSIGMNRHHAPVPPPKPLRTFQEQLRKPVDQLQTNTMGRFSNNQKFKSQTSSFMSSSVAFLSMCNHREFVDAINKRFTQGQCWFSRGGQLFFVNPFNTVSSPRCNFYSVIPTITSSLFEAKSSTLFLRGVSGSGKSHVAELICMDIVKRLDNQGQLSHLFKISITILRPFLTANNAYNNQCSKAVLHYMFQTKENRLHRISLKHFPIESMSRGCRANIFAIVANDLTETEKEKYRIAGFRLRETTFNYGNFEEIKAAMSIIGIDMADILKIISACILLNNINFKTDNTSSEVDNIADLEDASSLLGVSALTMYRFMVSDALIDSRLIRDNLVTALYARTVKYILDKINLLLDAGSDPYDRGSVVTDSGISVGTINESNHTVHIVDIPGYVRSTQNSLNELIVNAANDIVQCTDSDMVHELLKSVEIATRNDEVWTESKSPKMIKHCTEAFEIHYDLRLMIERNSNRVSRELVNLFDFRTCTFPFAVNLFQQDIESMIVDNNYAPSAINWPNNGKTVIQNVIESIRMLKKDIADNNSQQIICLKSNDSLEYARVHENGLGYQLNLYRSVMASSCTSSNRINGICARSPTNSTPKVFFQRQYAIREGRKHYFPQRRSVVIDFQDPSSGVILRAGEIVKAIGFSGECYLVENGRRARAAIPISFTEKSVVVAHNMNN